jgi:hypothetical protein
MIKIWSKNLPTESLKVPLMSRIPHVLRLKKDTR